MGGELILFSITLVYIAFTTALICSKIDSAIREVLNALRY